MGESQIAGQRCRALFELRTVRRLKKKSLCLVYFTLPIRYGSRLPMSNLSYAYVLCKICSEDYYFRPNS